MTGLAESTLGRVGGDDRVGGDRINFVVGRRRVDEGRIAPSPGLPPPLKQE
jgi:hypothetical protein